MTVLWRARRGLTGVAIALLALDGCRVPAAPPPPPARWEARAAPGVRWTSLVARCPGRVEAEQDVDEHDLFRLDAACVVEVTDAAGTRTLTWPPGSPGPVVCAADGRCARAP